MWPVLFGINIEKALQKSTKTNMLHRQYFCNKKLFNFLFYLIDLRIRTTVRLFGIVLNSTHSIEMTLLLLQHHIMHFKVTI